MVKFGRRHLCGVVSCLGEADVTHSNRRVDRCSGDDVCGGVWHFEMMNTHF